jgi:hypothetical protein
MPAAPSMEDTMSLPHNGNPAQATEEALMLLREMAATVPRIYIEMLTY